MGKNNDIQVGINAVSRISEGTVFNGEIESSGDIRVDGTFIGKIVSKGRVVVGAKAVVEGTIICENIDLSGKIQGDVFVRDTLSLKESCKINGNINIRRLAVELGAKFNGSCKMLSEGDFEKVVENEVVTENKNLESLNICATDVNMVKAKQAN